MRANNLQAKPEQLQAHIEELRAELRETRKKCAEYYCSDRRAWARVEALVVENNVIDYVLGKAKVTAKDIAFDELMGSDAAGLSSGSRALQASSLASTGARSCAGWRL